MPTIPCLIIHSSNARPAQSQSSAFTCGACSGPVTLAADYSPHQIDPIASPIDPRILGSIAALAVIVVALVISWKKSPLAAFFMLVFFIALFPVSNLVLIIGTIAAERLLYVSSLGWAGVIALAAAYLISFLQKRWSKAAFGLPCAIVALIAVLYGCRTWVRNNDWQNPATFWAVTSDTSPRSVRALLCYAEVLILNKGDLTDGLRYLEKAREIAPNNVELSFGLRRRLPDDAAGGE